MSAGTECIQHVCYTPVVLAAIFMLVNRRYVSPQVENISQTTHTTGRFTDNAGSRQLTPQVENNSQTMPAIIIEVEYIAVEE